METKRINKPKLKAMTFEQYNAKMNEIIARHGSVADALVEMLVFGSSVKIKRERKKI